MARTISSSIAGPVVPSDNPVAITSMGAVTSTGSSDAIDGGNGINWTITNAGIVTTASGNGVSLASSGGIWQCRQDLRQRRHRSPQRRQRNELEWRHLGRRRPWRRNPASTCMITGVAYGVGFGRGGMVTNTSSIMGGVASLLRAVR
jgi:hypothetical protein